MKKRVSIILVLMLLFSVPVSADSTTAYQKYGRSHSISKYTLADIDQDGTKEMFFLTKSYKYGVCTYKGGKVKKLASVNLGKYYPFIYYDTGRHQFALTNSDTGGARYWIYTLKGGKAKLVKTMKSERRYPSHDYSFYVNGKKTTEAAFRKAYQAVFKWKCVDLR